VSSARDLHELRDCGVAAVISGKALLENKISPEELRPFLQNA
jgi:phosphoribosylformimino-5-aminoimidazole carboxamide ribonucleotide (ProFAR) isomerase